VASSLTGRRNGGFRRQGGESPWTSAHATTAKSHLIFCRQMQQSQAQARARIHTPQRLLQESSHEAVEQVSSERGYPVQNPMPVTGVRKVNSFRTPLSDIPEVSFFREGGPDREPGDLVAGLFDGALDLLLLSLPSFE
jgi:hypothetical protein